MNPIKTPTDMAMEKLGANPASPGPIKTPNQMMMDLSGFVAHLAKGGSTTQAQFPKHDIPKVKQIQFDLSKVDPVKKYLKAGGRTRKKQELEKYFAAIMSAESPQK